MRTVTRAGITSSPTWGWLSPRQGTADTEKAATPGCCMPGEMKMQLRSIHPHQSKPGTVTRHAAQHMLFLGCMKACQGLSGDRQCLQLQKP